jgi:hypothetical protein
MRWAPRPVGSGVAGSWRRCCGHSRRPRPGCGPSRPVRRGGVGHRRPAAAPQPCHCRRLRPGGQRSLPGADGSRCMVVIGSRVAASNRRGLGDLTGRIERADAVSGSGLGDQAGDLAGVAFQSFQHGQDGQGDGGGDGPGDQIRVGVGDVAADRGQGAAADQQPTVAGPGGVPSGAADDPEHPIDRRPIRHHRDTALAARRPGPGAGVSGCRAGLTGLVPLSSGWGRGCIRRPPRPRRSAVAPRPGRGRRRPWPGGARPRPRPWPR